MKIGWSFQKTIAISIVIFNLARILIANQDLKKQIQVLKFRIEQAENKHSEQIKNQRRKNHEEVNQARKINYQLKCQIEGILLAKE